MQVDVRGGFAPGDLVAAADPGKPVVQPQGSQMCPDPVGGRGTRNGGGDSVFFQIVQQLKDTGFGYHAMFGNIGIHQLDPFRPDFIEICPGTV